MRLKLKGNSPCYRQFMDEVKHLIFPKTSEPAVTSKHKCDATTKLERIEECRTGLPSLRVFQLDYLAYLGMNIMMGIHVRPQIDNYWSSDDYLGFMASRLQSLGADSRRLSSIFTSTTTPQPWHGLSVGTIPFTRSARCFLPLQTLLPEGTALDVTCLSTRQWLHSRGGCS